MKDNRKGRPSPLGRGSEAQIVPFRPKSGPIVASAKNKDVFVRSAEAPRPGRTGLV